MAKMPKWLIQALYAHRPSVYIVAIGLVSLLTIPTLQQIPDRLGLLAWWMRIVGYLLSVSIAATLVHQLAQLAIPPRPTKPPPEKIDTAEIPISAQRMMEESEADEADASSEPNLERPQRLSRFARLRIGRQYPGLQHSPPLFEQGKSAIELFVQLDERKLLKGRRLTIFGWRQRREESTIIYGRVLIFAAFVWLTVLAANTMQHPDPDPGLDVVDVILAILLVCCIVTGLRLLYRLDRWHSWRFVGLEANPEAGFEGKVVIIDKPRFFPGGGADALNLARISKANSLTAPSEEYYGTVRSQLAGYLGIEWIKLDSESQEDKAFHWIGPLRNAPQLVSVIDRASTSARKQD